MNSQIMKFSIKDIKSLFLAFLFISLLIPAGMRAQDEPQPIGKKMKEAIVDSIADQYTKWDKVSISGKLSADFLPVTASVKIYMEKDKLTLISVSAPFVGEAARIEIDENSALIVNKMKKTYSLYDIEGLQELCPGGIQEVQAMILGRIALLGKGQLSGKDAANLEIYDTNPESWILIPNAEFQQPGAVYFYTVGRNSLRPDRFILMSEDGQSDMEADYEWKKDGVNINMGVTFGKKEIGATLKLDSPNFNPKALDRIELGSKYRKVSWKELMR